MNAEVLNGIYKRRAARDFLRLYPSEKWKEIIPDVFEIGVLNLKNSFGTLKFTKVDLKNILDELRNYNSSEDILVEDESQKESQNNYRKNKNNFNNNNNNLNFNNNSINENSNNEYNDNDNEQNEYNNEEDEEYNEYNNENDNDNDEINNNKIYNNNDYNNQNNNMKNSKKDDKKKTSSTEVFIPDMRKINNNVNYNRPKIAYNSTFEEIKEKNIENKRNIGYTESKIKYQIMNDKMNHQAMKKRKISNDEINENDGSFSFNQNKNNRNENKKEKNTNKNYLINFDKHLNPEKPIEVQKKNEFKKNINNMDFNKIGNYGNNNINFQINNHSLENYEDENDNNFKNYNYNEDRIFNNNLNNNNSINNNINEKNNNNMSFGEQLNNFKIEKLNFPKYEYSRGFKNNI